MRSEDWKTLLDDEPDNELVRFSYAKALMDESSWAPAGVEFERLVRAQADYAIAWAFLARCRLRAGDKAGARDAYEHGIPAARKLGHEVPLEELEAVLQELDSEF